MSEAIDDHLKNFEYQRCYNVGYKDGYTKVLEDLQIAKQVQLGTNQVIIVKE